MNKIKVLLVEANEEPKEVEIENTEDTFRKIVGGELEYIKLENNVKLICNKNGKQKDLEFNRVIENDVVAGKFIVVGYKKGTITSLEDINRQMKYFNLKNDEGMIEFFRRYIVKSSNIIEQELDLNNIGYNRGFITLDEEDDEELEVLDKEMKQECVNRLKLLRVNKFAKAFESDNTVLISYVDKNVIYKINEYEQEIINNLQLYKKLMVYHIIRLDNNVTYYLYVDRNKEKWTKEKRNLLDGYLEAICIKPEDRMIGVETTNGVITKIV